eukprot:symbB.v1.2.008257.t1/scaffold517.1/size193155/4
MTAPELLPFYVREKESLKLYGFANSQVEEVQAPPFPLNLPKASCWSPDGIALAMVDPVQGPQVAVFNKSMSQATIMDLPGAPKNAYAFIWSPLGSALVSIAPGGKNLTEPNVHVWRRSGAGDPGAGAGVGGDYTLQAQFCHPKLEKDKKVLQWTLDENLCARLTTEGKIQLHDGADLAESPLMELRVNNVAGFEFAPLQVKEGFHARLALFVADQRDDLQRVVGPAEVSILELTASMEGFQTNVSAKMSVPCGQVADLLWNSAATCLIAHCQTEVDETGQSYYGGSRLAFMSQAGEVRKDITDEECQGGCVQAVSWSPTRDEFILISGFQPAKATLFSWDDRTKKLAVKKVLLDKAHRNTIRFNSFGSLVCLAGFGNLAGGVDFFGREDDDYVHVSSCTANCTVSAEWAPDGRHFLTAVLAPRMRVDNGLSVWHALSGSQVCSTPFEELFDVQWRPEPKNQHPDVTQEEISQASKEDAKNVVEAGAQKKQAYRPPKARGENTNTVAQMMRGEVAAPEDDRSRNRKTRQKAKEDDEPVETKEGAAEGANARPPPPEAPAPPPPRPPPAQPPKATPAADLAQQAKQAQAQAAAQQAQQAAAAQAAAQAQAAQAAQRAKAEAQKAAADRQRILQQQQAEQEELARAMHDMRRATGYGGLAPGDARYQAAAAQNAAAANAARQRAGYPGNEESMQISRMFMEQHAAQLKQHQQQQQLQAQARAQVMSSQQQQKANQMSGQGQKQPPSTGWQYIDPKNQIQGPFSLLEMQQWYHMNYFRPELKMRCSDQDEFVPFKELFPAPSIPFQSYPKRVPARR